jgi:ABC-2 type transport system permease protein
MSAAGIYVKMITIQIRSQREYASNFLLSIAGTFLFSSLELAAILILFTNIHSLGSWTAPEVVFLYAASSTSYAIADSLLGALDLLPEMIRTGDFDGFLYRPRSPYLQVLTSDIQLNRLGRLLQSVIVLVVVIVGFVGVRWSLLHVVVLLAALSSGAVILGAVWTTGACLCFWIDGAGEFVKTFSSGAAFVTQYPVSVYPSWLQRAVTYIVPLAFVIYIPASYILDKPFVPQLGRWAGLVSPAVALLAAAVAGMVWHVSLKRYRSAGG